MVPSILARSDVSLVHLKPRDVFRTVIPSKMFESMAAGVPIVLGVEGEANRILTEASAGIGIEPDNSTELATAVETLYDDPTKRRSFGENGRRYVREHFAWESIADAYADNLVTLVETA